MIWISDEWKDYPDGIRIEEYKGETYNAHIMIIRDPSLVYMATSTDGAFSTNIPGTRIHNEIVDEGAIAAINAGAFNDDGSANDYVGSIPAGLLMVNGEVKSNKYANLVPEEGFAGFTFDNNFAGIYDVSLSVSALFRFHTYSVKFSSVFEIKTIANKFNPEVFIATGVIESIKRQKTVIDRYFHVGARSGTGTYLNERRNVCIDIKFNIRV